MDDPIAIGAIAEEEFCWRGLVPCQEKERLRFPRRLVGGSRAPSPVRRALLAAAKSFGGSLVRCQKSEVVAEKVSTDPSQIPLPHLGWHWLAKKGVSV